MSKLIVLITICCQISLNGAVDENYWPTHGWRTATPEMQGIDSNVLADALAEIREKKIPIHSLLIERNGYVLLDAYFFPFEDGQTQHRFGNEERHLDPDRHSHWRHKLTGVDQRVLPIFPGQSILHRDVTFGRKT